MSLNRNLGQLSESLIPGRVHMTAVIPSMNKTLLHYVEILLFIHLCFHECDACSDKCLVDERSSLMVVSIYE
jgi:hypothetical protein